MTSTKQKTQGPEPMISNINKRRENVLKNSVVQIINTAAANGMSYMRFFPTSDSIYAILSPDFISHEATDCPGKVEKIESQIPQSSRCKAYYLW